MMKRNRALISLLALWVLLGVWRVSAQNASVSLNCGSSRLVITVEMNLFGNGVLVQPEELVLGKNCSVSHKLEDILLFDYLLQDCGAVRKFLSNTIQYENQLHYRPSHTGVIQRTNAVSMPVSCFYPRTGNTSSLGVQPTWSPFRSTYHGKGRLEFMLQLYDNTWSAPQKNAHYFYGDLLNIQASMVTLHHVPLRIYVDECVARPSKDSILKYEVIIDHGCLVDGVQSRSKFVRPRGDDFLRFQLDVFTFAKALDKQIILICHLKVVNVDTAMTQARLNKACSYNSSSAAFSSEEPGEDCSCCNSAVGCRAMEKRRRRQLMLTDSHWEANVSLGPILIMPTELDLVTLESAQAVVVHPLIVDEDSTAQTSSVSLDWKMMSLPLIAMLAFILGFIGCRATCRGHQPLRSPSEDAVDQLAMRGLQ
ncbi:zona pellucida sperm-binding protein 3 isoform X2 [Microcaecilia unicolor]|uniref:Zona pellucida sperm-binding protein 3 n=1 Tax=Microcaecilia unicolor TaxID=1415580 RepID=A0A6P7X123_9AMPH|nr:zona pellucida sperm-binding protein 3-like isoform X2 [Microcaecilia unicolor]